MPRVWYLLGVGDIPTPVDSSEMQRIRVLEMSMRKNGNIRLLFQPNEAVVVTGGLLEGLRGTVVGYEDNMYKVRFSGMSEEVQIAQRLLIKA